MKRRAKPRLYRLDLRGRPERGFQICAGENADDTWKMFDLYVQESEDRKSIVVRIERVIGEVTVDVRPPRTEDTEP